VYSSRTNWTCRTHAGDDKFLYNLVAECEDLGVDWRAVLRLVSKEILFEGLGWIQLAQDRVEKRFLMNLAVQ
jgi:hypothetical protein